MVDKIECFSSPTDSWNHLWVLCSGQSMELMKIAVFFMPICMNLCYGHLSWIQLNGTEKARRVLKKTTWKTTHRQLHKETQVKALCLIFLWKHYINLLFHRWILYKHCDLIDVLLHQLRSINLLPTLWILSTWTITPCKVFECEPAVSAVRKYSKTSHLLIEISSV